MLTITDSDQVIREALDAGARGFVLKSDAARDLVSAVEALQNKRMFFTPRVNDLVLAGFLEKGRPFRETKRPSCHPDGARTRDYAIAGRRQQLQGSCVASESEHQDRRNSPQQHYAEAEFSFDPRPGGLRDQEQSDPD